MRKVLKFWDSGEGFSLYDPTLVDELEYEDYEFAEKALHDEKGAIELFRHTFITDMRKELDSIVQDARRLNIPGRYDVPELGIENATFVEVLEAVRKYYRAKRQAVAK